MEGCSAFYACQIQHSTSTTQIINYAQLEKTVQRLLFTDLVLECVYMILQLVDGSIVITELVLCTAQVVLCVL